VKNIKGKVALITGGAMGMGALLAKGFAEKSARVVIIDLNKTELKKTASEIKKSGGEVYQYPCDVTDYEQVIGLAKKVHKNVGKVDLLVNNAGVVFAGNFMDTPIEKHRKMVDVNIMGLMIISHVFLKDLIEKKAGHIVNMASATGLMGVANLTCYSATKFAVVGFSESLYYELRRQKLKKIKITTVCPSFVDTGMFKGGKPALFSPWVDPHKMVAKIIEGIEKEKELIMEPFSVKTIPILKLLLSRTNFARTSEILGVSSSMDTWKGRD
jgi:all-trans-retinol dehydrogenase (NAD+)